MPGSYTLSEIDSFVNWISTGGPDGGFISAADFSYNFLQAMDLTNPDPSFAEKLNIAIQMMRPGQSGYPIAPNRYPALLEAPYCYGFLLLEPDGVTVLGMLNGTGMFSINQANCTGPWL